MKKVSIFFVILFFVIFSSTMVFAASELGDMNQDGVIDDTDVDLLNKFNIGTYALPRDKEYLADVNRDGKVNIIDVIRLRKVVIAKQYPEGDVTRNGVVDKEDVTLLDSFLLGKESFDQIQRYIADVDKDGAITSNDSLALLKMTMNIETKTYELGDMNQDGVLDDTDVDLLLKYRVETYTLPADKEYLADVDENGEVDIIDVIRLRKIVNARQYPEGDVTRDGKVDREDLNLLDGFLLGKEYLNPVQKYIADVDRDGKITSNDSLALLKMLPKEAERELGDVNLDGVVDEKDVKLLDKFLLGTEKFITSQKEVADVDQDGKITSNDSLALLKMVQAIEKVEYELGDMNLDGEITDEDVDLLNKFNVGTYELPEDKEYLADVNEDGKVNIMDVIRLRKIVLQK